jgi:hypothetical protein
MARPEAAANHTLAADGHIVRGFQTPVNAAIDMDLATDAHLSGDTVAAGNDRYCAPA